ncbi:NADPH-dependent FMN reductase [Bacillaceae bacterium CLA-AA-H227]|uniref:NADPH-dependent FMN reductase n=1 Tax=Robertmurraya yapensis (ex Hitch et al 2024) TaxID=3133160 RepID=A0ACC6S9H8_9BACI
MKFVALVGSTRKESLNLGLVKTLQERYGEKVEISIADIGELPFYNQDDENNPSDVVKQFKEEIAHSDGVLIATPEYNWTIPGVLKNALDWLSRVDKVLVGKPVMIVGVSGGQVGSLRAQLHLRQILASPGLAANVLPAAGNEVLVNFGPSKFKDGKLIDEATLTFIDGVFERFVDWVKK